MVLGIPAKLAMGALGINLDLGLGVGAEGAFCLVKSRN